MHSQNNEFQKVISSSQKFNSLITTKYPFTVAQALLYLLGTQLALENNRKAAALDTMQMKLTAAQNTAVRNISSIAMGRGKAMASMMAMQR